MKHSSKIFLSGYRRLLQTSSGVANAEEMLSLQDFTTTWQCHHLFVTGCKQNQQLLSCWYVLFTSDRNHLSTNAKVNVLVCDSFSENLVKKPYLIYRSMARSSILVHPFRQRRREGGMISLIPRLLFIKSMRLNPSCWYFTMPQHRTLRKNR